MIQPVSAFSPRAVFRGSNRAYGKATKPTNSVALINAGGLAALAGGLTTIVARAHTPNWLHASVVGICGAFLALFFMTPQLIEKTNSSNLAKQAEADVLMKEDSKKFLDVFKEKIKPAAKKVHFKQS